MTDTAGQEEKIQSDAIVIREVESARGTIASIGVLPPLPPGVPFFDIDSMQEWARSVLAELEPSKALMFLQLQEKQDSKLETAPSSRVEVRRTKSKQLEREANDKLRLENQLLQSRVSEERRNAGRATRLYDQLLSEFHGVQAQYDKLLECLNGRIEALDTTTKLLLQRSNGRLRMIESYEGVVEHVQGDSATVVFEIDDDIVEHTYKRSQFIDGQLPEEGDRLAVYVHVVHGELEKSNDASAVVDELDDGQEYERKKITGQVEF